MAWTPQNLPDSNGYPLPNGGFSPLPENAPPSTEQSQAYRPPSPLQPNPNVQAQPNYLSSPNIAPLPPTQYGPTGNPNISPVSNPNLMPPVPGTAGPGPNLAPQPLNGNGNQGERYLPQEVYQSPGAAPMNQAPAPQFVAPPMQPQAMAPGPMPPQQQPAAPVMQAAQKVTDDDQADAGDARWINRSKSIIAQTQGDPYRQVQLLQQMRVMYLKERYGRVVQAKEK